MTLLSPFHGAPNGKERKSQNCGEHKRQGNINRW
jgi:hypothetical protein